MAQQFYLLVSADMAENSPWLEWENQPIDGPPPSRTLPRGPIPDVGNQAQGIGSGFPEDTPKPLLRWNHSRAKDERFDFLMTGGLRLIWIVSERAKAVLERWDTWGFRYLEADVIESDGSKSASYWLCDLTRYLNALDERKSDITEVGPIRRLRLKPGGKAIFQSTVTADNRIFRLMYDPLSIYCDAAFKDAIEAAGLKGLWFSPRASAI